MPIVAVCPYCTRGRIRTTEEAVGTLAKCPSCTAEFIVIPTDEAVTTPAGSVSPTSSKKLPSVVAQDLPARRRPPPPDSSSVETPPDAMPAPPVFAVDADTAASPDEADERGLFAADPSRLPAMIAVAVALAGAIAWMIPDYGRLVWLGLAVVAAGIGGWSFLAADRKKLFAWVALGSAGGSLLLCLVVPWLLGEGWWPARGYNQDEPVALGLNGELTEAGQAIDVTKAAWAKNGVRVTVVEVSRKPEELPNKRVAGKRDAGKSAVPVFAVTVEVANDGRAAVVPFSGWGADAVLLTADGRRVPVKAFPPEVIAPPGIPANARPLTTGTGTRQKLYFEPLPADAGGRGTLELPATVVGSPGEPIRFTVPFPDVSWTAPQPGGSK